MSDTIPNILIVEDDTDLQMVYSMILKSQGNRVETASDGLLGLMKLRDFTPDVILLDYFMPNMDGKVFLQNFDAEKYPNTKVIVTSNVSDQHTLDELLELGAQKTVLKANLSPSELIALVDEALVS